MKVKTLSLSLALLCFLNISAAQSILGQKIHRVMEDMDLPERGIAQLVKKGEFQHKDFAAAMNELVGSMEKLNELKYPEENFRNFAQNSSKQLLLMQKMLKEKSASSKELKKQWLVVTNSCNACHSTYRK